MGSVRFLLFYALSGVAAALAQTAATIMYTPELATIPNVGASGAVAGVLGAYLVLFPGARVRTLIGLGFFWSTARIPALIVLGLWFVTQFFGGPPRYNGLRGHPRLRMRHAPFAIGQAERDAWVRHMLAAIDEAGFAEPARAALIDYFERAATFLINSQMPEHSIELLG